VSLALAVILAACGSAPVDRPEPTPVPTPEPSQPAAAETEPLAPIPHDGPLEASPGFYDCGVVPELERCDFDILLTNSASEDLVIQSIRQNVSPWAAIGLVDHNTGFDRDLPYTMGGERLRLLFSYRRDDSAEVAGGSLFVEYRHQGRDLRLEIPVRVD
jgi:hypothetical protein